MSNVLHIYTRVSSAMQQEDGTSLDAQRQLGQRKAEELGVTHQVWNEGGQSSFSDDLNNRPVLVSLLRSIEMGIVKHVFVYNTDRLSRNQRTWAVIRYKLLEHGVTLHTASGQMQLKNPVDDLLLGILSEISQYDNRIRAERSRLGRFHKVQLGNWKGGPPPFGYKLVDRRLEVDTFESQWIQRIYDWYCNGVPIKQIQERLARNGVNTRRGNAQWSLGSIQLILRNPVYVGYFDYTDKMVGQTVRITTPALIGATVFQAAQDRRTSSRHRRERAEPTKHFYLLRGLLVCAHCGTQMGGRISNAGHQNVYYCVRKERTWKTAPEHREKWVRGNGCTMTRSINIDRTNQLVRSMIASVIQDLQARVRPTADAESISPEDLSQLDQTLVEYLTGESVQSIDQLSGEDLRELIQTVASTIEISFNGSTGKHTVDIKLVHGVSRLIERINEPCGRSDDVGTEQRRRSRSDADKHDAGRLLQT